MPDEKKKQEGLTLEDLQKQFLEMKDNNKKLSEDFKVLKGEKEKLQEDNESLRKQNQELFLRATSESKTDSKNDNENESKATLEDIAKDVLQINQ